jgi:hypothetical protein
VKVGIAFVPFSQREPQEEDEAMSRQKVVMLLLSCCRSRSGLGDRVFDEDFDDGVMPPGFVIDGTVTVEQYGGGYARLRFLGIAARILANTLATRIVIEVDGIILMVAVAISGLPPT